jgi:hypothetical protein
MATRDLTRQFLQLRADEKAKVLRRKNIVSHREEGNALMKSAEQEATSVAIAPGWVDVVNGTNQHVARIKDMSTWGSELEGRRRNALTLLLLLLQWRSSISCIRAASWCASTAPSPNTSRRSTT